MSFSQTTDLVAAAATPPGRGGLGVIRVSGPGSLDLGRRLFRASAKTFAGFIARHLHHGTVRDQDGRILDEVLCVFMPGPASYTGEDVLEIHGHGGPAALRRVLEAVFAAGARPAGPGEFTRRAFLNGRLDLSRAEAVAELIGARGDAQADMAVSRLRGLMGDLARQLRAVLLDLRAKLCLAVDFPEEEVECLAPEAFAEAASGVLARCRELLTAHERARPWREGALLALFGRVNAGKSSLFNALLGRERALVTAFPGTTRDFLEEGLELAGLPVRLADTAGLRRADEAVDEVERLGLSRGLELAERADLGLFVVDGSVPFRPGQDPEDMRLASKLGPKRVLAAVNKADLASAVPEPAEALAALGFEVVSVSAKTGQGIDALVEAARRRLTGGASAPEPDQATPNLRQAEALRRAEAELSALLADLAADLPYDLLGVRLEGACDALGEITGDIAPEEVINAVFAEFCVGK